MFWVRLRSSAILIVIAAAALLAGGKVLFTVLMLVSLAGVFELYRVIKMENSLPGWLGYVAVVLLYLMVGWNLGPEWMLAFFIAWMLGLLAIYVFTFPRYRIEEVAVVFLGLFYVAWMLSFIYRIRCLQGGIILVWMVFIGSWGSDTCAYCVGNLIGKHRLPGGLRELSPHKSVEGCLGGVIGAALIGLLYGFAFAKQLLFFDNPALACALIGGASSVISQVGDLAASAIKRNHDVKDYGRLIPGHGGILDRFDAVIFTAPIIYGLVRLLAG